MTTMTIVTDHDVRTTTTEAVAEALTAIRGQKWSGTDIVISHHRQWKRCSMECKDLLISSLSAGNSFALVEHFRRGCKQSSQWQVR
jgi:hypothetical protein